MEEHGRTEAQALQQVAQGDAVQELFDRPEIEATAEATVRGRSFAGLWYDQSNGTLNIAFTSDTADHLESIR